MMQTAEHGDRNDFARTPERNAVTGRRAKKEGRRDAEVAHQQRSEGPQDREVEDDGELQERQDRTTAIW